MAHGTLLRASGLGKRFWSNWVFRNLDFELQRDQGLIIVGRNGSGKSTLLKCLAGLLTPTEGAVQTASLREGTDVAMSALDQSVYPQLSIREHLDLFGQLRGCDSRADELLEKNGLAAFAGRLAYQLSTGMRNRLKLALAIQSNPWLLLLDEPGAALDEKGKTLVESICREQLQRGALVVATNDPSERRLGTHELELQ
jgi:ABC-type multidrug transport system ATPase subunit